MHKIKLNYVPNIFLMTFHHNMALLYIESKDTLLFAELSGTEFNQLYKISNFINF